MEKAKVYFTDFRTPYGSLSMPRRSCRSLLKLPVLAILILKSNLRLLRFISVNRAMYLTCVLIMPRL